MRILGPLINFVDRPWKMYPVGILFGFGALPAQEYLLDDANRRWNLGFDTASSIALLAVSALAKHRADGSAISPSNIVLLPVCLLTWMWFVII